jgi:ABC-type phosphate/phosphonate transport system permease subunit
MISSVGCDLFSGLRPPGKRSMLLQIWVLEWQKVSVLILIILVAVAAIDWILPKHERRDP